MLETNIEASPKHAIASVRFCIESLLGRFLMRFQGIPHTRVIQHDGDHPQPCPKRNDRRRECGLCVWNVLAASKQRWEGETIARRYRRYHRIRRRLRRMTDHAVRRSIDLQVASRLRS